MAEHSGSWPAASMPPPGWRLPPVVHSAGPGQSPDGQHPDAIAPDAGAGPFATGSARPRYREPHPVRMGPLLAGIGGGTAWLMLFGLIGRDLSGYLWYTALATVTAWLVAVLLSRFGDRGVAAGIALSTALGSAVATGSAVINWVASGDWPMW